MKRVIRLRRIVVALHILGTLCVPLSISGKGNWTWKDATGRSRTENDLAAVLKSHEIWVQSGHAQGSRADLSKADLHGAYLESAELGGASLQRANLRGADFVDAHLEGALLYGSDLRGANLGNSSLDGADLSQTDLRGAELHHVYMACEIGKAECAKLVGANMRGSHIQYADLSGVSLVGADLTYADLSDTNLSNAQLNDAELKGATFDGADLKGVDFEPKSNPDLRSIAASNNLELLTYKTNPDALVQLRKQFEERGFREQERKITYALNRRRIEGSRFEKGAPPIERWFNRIAFDLTCQYGMNPGRTLKMWLALLVLSSFLYVMFIHLHCKSGIYIVKHERDSGVANAEKLQPRRVSRSPWWKFPFRLVYRELVVLFWAIFFSLMSAFNIAFRDIDFGRWLRLLPPYDLHLKAHGWTRTVAGFQSLISIYLLSLWALTYFGRPFD